MKRCLAPVIGLLALLVPALACAQTNLDQGRSAAQIFSLDCIECHKAPHALANGKNASTLTDFLGEHYTTNRAQAAALAAYILGTRASESGGATTQAHHERPAAEHASAAPEEPKPAKRQAHQGGKPEQEGVPANAKLHRPGGEDGKGKQEANTSERASPANPTAKPESGHAHGPAAAVRNRRKDLETPPSPQEPPAVAHVAPTVTAEPAPAETPTQEAVPSPAAAPAQETAPSPSPTAAAPSNDLPARSGEDAPAERDNIPD